MLDLTDLWGYLRPGQQNQDKPWAEWEECGPVKTFLREAQSKTVERWGILLVQQNKKVHKAFIVYRFVHVYMLAAAKIVWLCYANWTR